jgi:hypothetical protein
MRRSRVFTLALVALSVVVLAGCSKDSSPADGELSAELDVSPSNGTIITDFVCDAGGSSVSSRALECRWDWESDGTWDTDWSGDLTVEHRFSAGDTIVVSVEVTNGDETDASTDVVILDTRHGAFVHDVPVAGSEPRALEFDGSYLWLCDWNDNLIRKLDPATGDSVGAIPAPSSWPNGIAWDGTNLWVSDYMGGMRMFKVDPATGDTLLSFPIQYSPQAAGVAWDGEYLYEGVSNGGAEGIMKYTPTGTYVGAIESPRGLPVNGLSYDGVNLWVSVADVDTMYAVDPSDGSVRFCTYVDGLTRDVAVDDEGYIWAITESRIVLVVP